jgi:hypothetical protein
MLWLPSHRAALMSTCKYSSIANSARVQFVRARQQGNSHVALYALGSLNELYFTYELIKKREKIGKWRN